MEISNETMENVMALLGRQTVSLLHQGSVIAALQAEVARLKAMVPDDPETAEN